MNDLIDRPGEVHESRLDAKAGDVIYLRAARPFTSSLGWKVARPPGSNAAWHQPVYSNVGTTENDAGEPVTAALEL